MPKQHNTLGSDFPWEDWDSADESNAPLKVDGMDKNSVGFSSDGRMWRYSLFNDTWTDTGQTFNGFIGL